VIHGHHEAASEGVAVYQSNGWHWVSIHRQHDPKQIAGDRPYVKSLVKSANKLLAKNPFVLFTCSRSKPLL
jgi:hypothetical protein